MNAYNYDLHIHSCLSPCADDDMTPGNIAGMATLNGLQIVGLTDHNSTKNCPAFFAAAKHYGLVPVPGMELCTAEEIHLICLFPTLDTAMDFRREVEKHFRPVKNRAEIFGHQLIVGTDDSTAGEEETLLILATDLGLEDAAALCRGHGGACFPAHIDRESNGIIGILGKVPDKPRFPWVELSGSANIGEYAARTDVKGKGILRSSDAHQLWNISESGNTIELEDEPYSAQRVREALIKKLSEDI